MAAKRKVKIRRTFYSGFVLGTVFTLVLVFLIQGWDMIRHSWLQDQTPPRNSRKQAPAEEGVLPYIFDDLEGKPAQGPSDAEVTLIEFSDFHCPYCRRLSPDLDRLMKTFPDKVRRIWRHFPLVIHAGAEKTHAASECAHEQGNFWAFHDAIFQAKQHPESGDDFRDLAKRAKLNLEQFEACLDSGKFLQTVRDDIEAGKKAGVRGTPTLFVNGKRYIGARPYHNLEMILKRELNS